MSLLSNDQRVHALEKGPLSCRDATFISLPISNLDSQLSRSACIVVQEAWHPTLIQLQPKRRNVTENNTSVFNNNVQ